MNEYVLSFVKDALSNFAGFVHANKANLCIEVKENIASLYSSSPKDPATGNWVVTIHAARTVPSVDGRGSHVDRFQSDTLAFFAPSCKHKKYRMWSEKATQDLRSLVKSIFGEPSLEHCEEAIWCHIGEGGFFVRFRNFIYW